VATLTGQPNGEQDDAPSGLVEGYLCKLTSKRKWKKRYFVLDGDANGPSLVYFPSKSKSHRRRKAVFQPQQSSAPSSFLVKVESKMLILHLTSSNGAVYALKASSRADSSRWRAALVQMCAVDRKRHALVLAQEKARREILEAERAVEAAEAAAAVAAANPAHKQTLSAFLRANGEQDTKSVHSTNKASKPPSMSVLSGFLHRFPARIRSTESTSEHDTKGKSSASSSGSGSSSKLAQFIKAVPAAAPTLQDASSSGICSSSTTTSRQDNQKPKKTLSGFLQELDNADATQCEINEDSKSSSSRSGSTITTAGHLGSQRHSHTHRRSDVAELKACLAAYACDAAVSVPESGINTNVNANSDGTDAEDDTEDRQAQVPVPVVSVSVPVPVSKLSGFLAAQPQQRVCVEP
jgi:hypothetical protein